MFAQAANPFTLCVWQIRGGGGGRDTERGSERERDREIVFASWDGQVEVTKPLVLDLCTLHPSKFS